MTRLLIRNAGHEVRTPLNSIINYLEIALEETHDERARYHLQRSLQASKSLVYIVNDLLNLTEAEVSDFQIHEENVDLRSMLSEVVAAYRDEASRRHLHINLEDDSVVPRSIRCDPAGLRQAISNLLANAVQNSECGQITVGLQHVETTQTVSVIKISITDDGRGLSEEQLDSIFQDFEQILDDDENSTSGQREISRNPARSLQIGLGLATAARFVRLHSGQITMSSEGIGKGTSVSVIIPFRKALSGDFSRRRMLSDMSLPTPPSDALSSQDPTSYSSASSNSAVLPSNVAAIDLSSPEASMARYPLPISSAPDHRPRFKVLVAEDNPLNSRLLETRLGRRGHTVKVAVEGKACVDTFKASPQEFDIILMDIQVSGKYCHVGRAIFPTRICDLVLSINHFQMPIVDGMEATRMIRELEKAPFSNIEYSPRVVAYGRIPIVAVSASLSEERVHEYVDNGFDGWILKPIDFKRLEAILTAVEDEQTREILLYGAGIWHKGGWFKAKSEV